MIGSRRYRGGPFWRVAVIACALTAIFAGWRIGAHETADPPDVGQLWSPPSPSTSAAGARRHLPPAADREQPRWSGRPVVTPTSSGAVPRRLQIPRLGLTIPIQPTTVAQGQMALPAHPSEIGWYSYGPSPFDGSGAAVLAGHVDSRQYGAGPLAGLRLLRPGDAIVVLGEGKRIQFRIVAVQLVRKQSTALAAAFDRSGPARLELITCGGEYLPTEGGYQRNVVVSAVPR